MDELFVVGGQHAAQSSETFTTDCRRPSSAAHAVANNELLLFCGWRRSQAEMGSMVRQETKLPHGDHPSTSYSESPGRLAGHKELRRSTEVRTHENGQDGKLKREAAAQRTQRRYEEGRVRSDGTSA